MVPVSLQPGEDLFRRSVEESCPVTVNAVLAVKVVETDWRMPATVTVLATRLADYSLAICQ